MSNELGTYASQRRCLVGGVAGALAVTGMASASAQATGASDSIPAPTTMRSHQA